MPPSRLDEVLAVGMMAAPGGSADAERMSIGSMTLLLYEKSCLLSALRPLPSPPTEYVNPIEPRYNFGSRNDDFELDPPRTRAAFEQRRDRRQRLLDRLARVERDLAAYANALHPGFANEVHAFVAEEPLPFEAFQQSTSVHTHHAEHYARYLADFRAGVREYREHPDVEF